MAVQLSDRALCFKSLLGGINMAYSSARKKKKKKKRAR